MKRKTAIKILILLIVIIVGIFFYFTFFNDKEESGGEVVLPDQPSSNFFPTTEDFDPELEDEDEPINNNNRISTISKLRQISDNPVAGFSIFDKTSTTSNILVTENNNDLINPEKVTVYRFVNKSNGNIFETTSRTSSLKRITNNTIPKVQNVFFSNDGNNVIFRYLDDYNSIVSYFSKIIMDNNSTTTQTGEGNFAELSSIFLPTNIDNINITDLGLVSYTNNSITGTNGVIFDLKTPENQNISFDSKLSEIKTEWFSDNSILIGTKPSNISDGLVFEYNLDTQKTEKILGGGTGFNFISDYNNNKIIFSELSGSEIKSYSYNKETNETNDLNLNTIVSDKCAWSNLYENIIYCAVPSSKIGFGYPTLWYQGRVSFNDKLYKIDTESGLKLEITGLLDNNFDITKIQVSEDDEYIVFVNKKDLTLWSLDIK